MSTTEECNARNTFEHLKVKMDVLVTQIEDTLDKAPISAPALRKRIESTGTAWDDFEAQYDKMRNSSGDKRSRIKFRPRKITPNTLTSSIATMECLHALRMLLSMTSNASKRNETWRKFVLKQAKCSS